MFSKRITLLAVVTLTLAATACSKDKPGDPLAYAPSDSPYLLANLEPVPSAATDVWLKNAEQMMPMYEKLFDTIENTPTEDAGSELGLRIAKAMIGEMKGKFNRAGLEGIGLSMSARSAVYGIGLIPVMRMELGNPDAFKAFIARMETKVGQKLATGKVGDQAYWIAGSAEEKLQAIIALQDKQLVITLAPKAAPPAVLEQLLGLKLPEKSALDSDVLKAFNKERGYLAYGSGYVDNTKLINLLFGERSAVEKAFLDALGEKNPVADLSAACKAEHLSIAAQVPRLSFGYTALDAHSMSLTYLLETTPAVGAELSTLATAVPGLDAHGKGVLDFGFGIDLNALVKFVNSKAGAVAAKPYTCQTLLSFNEAFAKARENVNNPGVFMAAAAFKGFNATLSKFDMPEGQTPVIEGKLAIASDNPQSLLSMAGGFAPQFAALTLVPNAAPVPLPLDGMPPGTPPSFLAMSDKALGFSVGAGQEASLQAYLSQKSTGPSPLLHYGLDGAGMSKFFDMMIQRSEGELATAESALSPHDVDPEADPAETDTDATSPEKLAELRSALDSMKAVRDIYAKTVDRVDFSIFTTNRGVEMQYALKMK